MTGDQGERGEQGLSGDTGGTGERGDSGQRGVAGERGPKGDHGQHGERGEKGLRGATNRYGVIGYLILTGFVALAFYTQEQNTADRQDVEAVQCAVSQGLLSRQVVVLQSEIGDGEVFQKTSKSPEVRAYFTRKLPLRRELLAHAKAQMRTLGNCLEQKSP